LKNINAYSVTPLDPASSRRERKKKNNGFAEDYWLTSGLADWRKGKGKKVKVFTTNKIFSHLTRLTARRAEQPDKRAISYQLTARLQRNRRANSKSEPN